MRPVKVLGFAVVLVVVIAATCSTLFTRREEALGHEEFGNQLRSIFGKLIIDYYVPEQGSVAELDAKCRDSTPRPDISACVDFVETLQEIDSTLVTGIAYLEYLRRRAPSDVEDSVRSGIEDQIGRAKLTHESNVLRLDGWDAGDSDKWTRGWQLWESINEWAVSSDGQTSNPD